jgi:hypothetical protein
MTVNKRAAKASEESLLRIFTIPVAPNSTLGRIENEVSQNLAGFLGAHIAATEQALSEIEKDFANSQSLLLFLIICSTCWTSWCLSLCILQVQVLLVI